MPWELDNTLNQGPGLPMQKVVPVSCHYVVGGAPRMGSRLRTLGTPFVVRAPLKWKLVGLFEAWVRFDKGLSIQPGSFAGLSG